MKQLVQFLTTTACTLSLLSANAQLNPTISGDDMLCPNETGTLTTQQFDSYQWYIRYFGSMDTNPVAGATSQTLTVDFANFVPSYLSVVVTSGAEADTSAEFLVDGWAFAGMSVISSGDFEVGQNGESILCEGDTMYFEVMNPYNTNIEWSLNGTPIQGQNAQILAVTEGGDYTVEGAPAECPNLISNPGVVLTVIAEDCDGPAGLNDPILHPAQVFPNPVAGELNVSNTDHAIREIVIVNQLGQQVYASTPHAFSTTIATSSLQAGCYFITIGYDAGSETQYIIVR